MKKTITRVFGLMLAVALPMAGLTIAANTTSTAPASLQLDVAAASTVASPTAAPTVIPGNASPTPTSTARPIYNRPSTPYPTMVYNPVDNTYSDPLINGTAGSVVQRYNLVGSWWTNYANIMANTNTSMISVDDFDSSTIYVGPWSRTEIASDYIITLR